ncbi:MAG: hypothetical protein JWP37_2949 [Mucilaginibacter sp.]|nr:hypothetical protein [Mucilaginibacter sp.]
MKQCALTLILPIASEENASWLEKELNSIGQLLAKNPKIDFSKTSLTHFARFVILPTAKPYSSTKRLLFTSNFDGDFDLYAKELIDTNVAPALDAIFSRCDSYEAGTLLTNTKAVAFLNNRNINSQAFYVALPGATQAIISESADLRLKMDQTLNAGTISDDDKVAVALLHDEYEKLRTTHLSTARPKPVKATFGSFILGIISNVLEWIAGIRYGENNPQIRVETSNHLYDMEDLVTQNQMTVIVPVKKSILHRLFLRAILWGISIQVKTAKGSLSDLATIHFARWVIIDNGNNILFESNFDGSWENYIDDFVDHASVGMNVIWGNCIGYPKGGSKDIESFKSYIRQNQIPAQIFYSAYKDSTVRNILTDLSLSQKISSLSRPNGRPNLIMGYYGS